MYYASKDDGTFVGLDEDLSSLGERCMLTLNQDEIILIKDEDVLCATISHGYDGIIVLCNIPMTKFTYFKGQTDGLLVQAGSISA